MKNALLLSVINLALIFAGIEEEAGSFNSSPPPSYSVAIPLPAPSPSAPPSDILETSNYTFGPGADNFDEKLKWLNEYGTATQFKEVYGFWKSNLSELLSTIKRLDLPDLAIKILGDKINVECVRGSTPLTWSIDNNFYDLTDKLLDNNVNLPHRSWMEYLVEDAIAKNRIPLVRKVMQKVSNREIEGWLVDAAEHNKKAIRDILFQRVPRIDLCGNKSVVHDLFPMRCPGCNLAPFASDIFTYAMLHDDKDFVDKIVQEHKSKLTNHILSKALLLALCREKVDDIRFVLSLGEINNLTKITGKCLAVTNPLSGLRCNEELSLDINSDPQFRHLLYIAQGYQGDELRAMQPSNQSVSGVNNRSDCAIL